MPPQKLTQHPARALDHGPDIPKPPTVYRIKSFENTRPDARHISSEAITNKHIIQALNDLPLGGTYEIPASDPSDLWVMVRRPLWDVDVRRVKFVLERSVDGGWNWVDTDVSVFNRGDGILFVRFDDWVVDVDVDVDVDVPLEMEGQGEWDGEKWEGLDTKGEKGVNRGEGSGEKGGERCGGL